MAPKNLAGGRWRELSGEKNWEGLLDPLDLDLRQYLINYGELTQAILDAFIDNELSRFTGAPRYASRYFFDHVFLTAGRPYGYNVTKFFYGTAGLGVPEKYFVRSQNKEAKLNEANWMGYVAVTRADGLAAAGRRDIVVAWRGSVRPLDWVNDIGSIFLVPAGNILPERSRYEAQVGLGWLAIYTMQNPNSPFIKTSARDQIIQEVRRLVNLYQDEEMSITIVGHSLGSAAAIINAVDIVAHGHNKSAGRPDRSIPVTVFAFASPRVGNDTFKKAFDGFAPDLRLLRIANFPDIVPKLPSIGYADIGAELVINTLESQYLKQTTDEWHELEVYLHGVAGTQGSKGGFKLEVERDISLVNKKLDALKEEYMITASWWVEKNSGMMQGKDGLWTLQDHEEEEDDDA